MRRWMRAQAMVVVPILAVGLLSAAPIATPPASAAGVAPVITTPHSWTLAPGVPAPAGGPLIELASVSCASAAFCVAVGYAATSTTMSVIEQWNGSQWKLLIPSTPGVASDLYGVSCTSATFCVAVGDDQSAKSAPSTPLVDQWNGTSWTATIPPGPGAVGNELVAVSCLSPTFCMAAGDYASSGTDNSLFEEWNGTSWTLVANADPAGQGSAMTGVSCTSAKFCVAAGSTNNDHQTLVEQWNGAAWSRATTPDPSGVQDWLQAVSCLSPTFCTAVGASEPVDDMFSTVPLVVMWNGATWSVSPAPAAGFGDYLFGVSCITVNDCVAAGGFYTTNTNYEEADSDMLVYNGAAWAHVAVPQDSAGADSFGAVTCLSGWRCVAVGESLNFGAGVGAPLIATAPISRPGYRFVASDGGIFSFGAPFYGSMGGKPLNQPIVGMAVMPDGGGYYEVAKDGGVFNFGDAKFYGSMGGKPLVKPIVALVVTPDGLGYWEVASDGGVFNFGDAGYFGSMGGKALNEPIVGIAATPTGKGYYEVASDGGVFNFGDAVFHGSMGGKPLNQPIVAIGETASGGYYELASDGGMFAFNGAPFSGSMGGKPLNSPIVGFASVGTGGYYEVGADGGIFAFGGVPFDGSMGGKPLNAPIVGMTS